MAIPNLSILATTYTTQILQFTGFLSGDKISTVLTGIQGGPLISGGALSSGSGLAFTGNYTGSSLVPAQFYVYQLSGATSGAMSNAVTGQCTIPTFPFQTGQIVTGLICTGINLPVYTGTIGPVIQTGATTYINEI